VVAAGAAAGGAVAAVAEGGAEEEAAAVAAVAAVAVGTDMKHKLCSAALRNSPQRLCAAAAAHGFAIHIQDSACD
jgi:hypothetical protein